MNTVLCQPDKFTSLEISNGFLFRNFRDIEKNVFSQKYTKNAVAVKS